MKNEPINILLVEDNPGDRRLIREMLAEYNNTTFELKYADRLQAALEQLDKGGVDAVLSDLGLPDSQGLETLSTIYAKAPDLPIVVLTGLNDELLGARAVSKGAQDYLIKGQVDSNSLVRTIRHAIERKQAEERERQLHLQLDLSNRLASIGVMVEGIAHEINNPLVGVMGSAEMLLNEDIPQSAREAVETINDNAQRVAGIIKNLNTFARQQKLERTYVDINSLIKDTLDLRAASMETNNIKVVTDLDPTLPRTMVDINQIRQVFLNIIINAETGMKIANGKGNLLIKTGTHQNYINISFSDDGPGIAEMNLVHLFDPFFSTRAVGQGTGLGLSVCYGIVAGHNGHIYVKSHPGKGAVFTVELPIIEESVIPFS